jgi:hypothetical protein
LFVENNENGLEETFFQAKIARGFLLWRVAQAQ